MKISLHYDFHISLLFLTVRKSKHQKRPTVTNTLIHFLQKNITEMDENIASGIDITASPEQNESKKQKTGNFHCNLCNKSYR